MTAGQALFRSALGALSASGIPRLMAPGNSGIGSILSLHRIHEPSGQFEFGARRMSVSQTNFRAAIRTLIEQDYEFVTMSEAAMRIEAGFARRKFVCLTFDDGFSDTYSEAFSLCRTLRVPMVVYLISGVVRRTVPMWWLGLDQVVAGNEEIEFWRDGAVESIPAATAAQKRRAYFHLANWFVSASPDACRSASDRLEKRFSVDFMQLTDRHALTVEMIREMQASGLVEFGAHTVSHANLRRLCQKEAKREIADSVRDIEAITGTRVRHFAYPYGASHSAGPREFALCREIGLRTAVTTRMANVFPADRDRFHALPRLTLNGDYQGRPLLELLTSGTLPRIRQAVGRIRKIREVS